MVSVLLAAGHALELLVYLMLGTALQRLGWQSGPTLMLAVALAVSWRTGFVLITFRLARVAPRPAWTLAETAALSAAMLLMIAAPLMPRRTPGDPQRMPILLVHGWNCNAGIWWPLRRHLRSRRVGDVHAIDLPFWQPIDRQLDHLARSVETILAASPHDRLAIVGHSMGGVIARLFLETERGRTCTGRLISIASPHHGTVLARRALDPAGRDLSPDNAQLAEPAAVAAGVAVTTFYSDIDNFVSPQSSAKLAGAENLRCSEIGHMQLLFTSAVLEAVAFRLEHTR